MTKTKIFTKFILTISLTMTGLLCACSWSDIQDSSKYLSSYRPDVHQGNLITQEMINELRIGMSQTQVQFLLGVPLLKDQFHDHRWDYAYYVNPRFGKEELRRLIVYFDNNDNLLRYEYTDLPEEKIADQIILNKAKMQSNPTGKMKVVGKKAKR